VSSAGSRLCPVGTSTSMAPGIDLRVSPPVPAVVVLLLFAGCASVHSASPDDAAAGGATNSGAGGAGGAGNRPPPPPTGTGGAPPPCKNLQCKLESCAGSDTTSLTGTVYAPDGKLPLYNVLVYVPNAPVPPVPQGLACDRCGAIPPGEPLVAALTDSSGKFRLEPVPVGNNIPLVIQVGKWRRQIVIPSITACQETALTDPNQTRLPRNRSEGDMPHIAITTGVCDNLICLLPKLGVDPSEMGVAGEDKAIIFYWGELDTQPARTDNFDAHLGRMTSSTNLWRNLNELKKYDMVIASCECSEVHEQPAAYQAVTDYLAMGGRLFGTDNQYTWFKNSPDANLAGWAQIPGGSTPGQNPISLVTDFPKGKAFADWLDFVKPGLPYAQIESSVVFDNFAGVMQGSAQVWGRSAPQDMPTRIHPRFLTINTPVGVGADQQCGRAVHLDAHVAPVSATNLRTFPGDCGTLLRNGEEALAFFLFDVAACVQDDTKPVVPPPIVE
jgi:hypothetical protein